MIFGDLPVELQKAALKYLNAVYPEIAGTKDEIAGILFHAVTNLDSLAYHYDEVSHENEHVYANILGEGANVSDSGVEISQGVHNQLITVQDDDEQYIDFVNNYKISNREIYLKELLNETNSQLVKSREEEIEEVIFGKDSVNYSSTPPKLIFERGKAIRKKSTLGKTKRDPQLTLKFGNWRKEALEGVPEEESGDSTLNKPVSEILINKNSKMAQLSVTNFGILARPSTYSQTLEEDIREFIHNFENESYAND